jgi:hypothetical protein
MDAILRGARLVLFMVSILPGSLLGATYTLVTQTNGSGAIGRNPTNSVYPGGAVVTLTAVPASGWYFGGWSGDLTGTDNPVNVTMSSNTTIIASFLPFPDYALAVSISGNGSVAPSAGTYQSNTVIAITATPSNGWVFHHWSGDASGSANPLNLTMNGSKSLTANFVQPPTIAVQPTNAVANAGENASFFVSAIGTEPLSYEWRFNEVTLPGGTGAVLNLTNVQSSQAGSYRVVAGSPYGAATSQVAVLVVSCSGTNTLLACTETELRQAVAIGGHVRFCCNGTIMLTNTITIDRDVTLDGTGMSVTVSGGNAVRLFNVNTGVSLTVSNLMLTDGLKRGPNGANAAGAIPAQHGEPASGGALGSLGNVRTSSPRRCRFPNVSALGSHTLLSPLARLLIVIVNNSTRGSA